MATECEYARAQPRRLAEVPSGCGSTYAHPLGRLALAGNRAIAGLVGRGLSVQRAPGRAAPDIHLRRHRRERHRVAIPLRRSHRAGGAQLAAGLSPVDRLRHCPSQAEAALYTGSAVRPGLKYKYELRIDRDYFDKNFVNSGTRKGYNEYVTSKALKIPTSFFRRVAELTVKPPGGPTGPAGPAGGAPPVPSTSGAQTPLKAKATAGAALAALGANIAFNWIIGWQNEKRIAAALAAREAELKAVQLEDVSSGILLTFRFAGGVDSGEGPTAAARFEGLSYVTGRSADEARQTWNKQARLDVGSRYDFVWIPPLSPVAVPPPGWSPVARGVFADLKRVQFQRLEFAQIGGFDTDGTLGPHDFSTLPIASGWEFVVLRVPNEIPYYGPGGGYNTRRVTVESLSVAGGQVPAMIVDGTACVAVVAANSDTLGFFNDKGIAARTRIDDKVNALGAVVNIDEVRWLRLDQIRLKK